jgi:hypothetical protein
MPAKSHGKKRYAAKRQTQVKAAPVADTEGTLEKSPAAVATAIRPSSVGHASAPATQPAPRRYFVGKELVRVLIITLAVLAILAVLAVVLR